MFSACVAAFTALVATQAGAPGDASRLAAAQPASPIQELVLEALPPAPTIIERRTRTYGTVTIDHPKHLALRAGCARCHDPGPVTKIDFKPKIAHQRCIGCHKERQAGPSHCMGCHVKTAPTKALAEASPEGGEAGEAAASAAATPASGSARAAPAAATAGLRPALTVTRRPLPRHDFGFGLVAGDGVGLSLRIATRGDRFLRAYTVERVSGGDSARILTSLDLGIAHSPFPGWTAFAAGLAGFDAQERPELGFSPALGGRVGVEWTPPKRWPVRTVYLSMAGIANLRGRAYGRPTDGLRVFGTIGTSFSRRD